MEENSEHSTPPEKTNRDRIRNRLRKLQDDRSGRPYRQMMANADKKTKRRAARQASKPGGPEVRSMPVNEVFRQMGLNEPEAQAQLTQLIGTGQIRSLDQVSQFIAAHQAKSSARSSQPFAPTSHISQEPLSSTNTTVNNVPQVEKEGESNISENPNSNIAAPNNDACMDLEAPPLLKT